MNDYSTKVNKSPNELIKEGRCPNCGYILIRQEGCIYCPYCVERLVYNYISSSVVSMVGSYAFLHFLRLSRISFDKNQPKQLFLQMLFKLRNSI